MIDIDLRTSELNFIGKVLCVFTHEVNNRLAILKESVGLIGDLIEMGKVSRKDLEGIMSLIESIRNQISKTAYFCNSLNSFGHGMVETSASFAVNKIIDDLLCLLDKLAAQKRITFKKEFKEGIPLIHGNPLKLQFLVFYFIEKNLTRLEKNSSIIIKTSRSEDTINIDVIPKGIFVQVEDGAGGDTAYQFLANNLGASISVDTPEGGITIRLPLPSSAA